MGEAAEVALGWSTSRGRKKETVESLIRSPSIRGEAIKTIYKLKGWYDSVGENFKKQIHGKWNVKFILAQKHCFENSQFFSQNAFA